MRPEHTRETKRSTAVARGRMFLKSQLAWLPGYPLARTQAGGIDWQPLSELGAPRQTPIRLDRSHLQQATYTWSKLVHRFPRALPRIVDDETRWRLAVPQLLELLKATIHHGKALPASLLGLAGAYERGVPERAARLTEREPVLRPLIDALSWCCLQSRGAFEQALEWIEQQRAQFARIVAQSPKDKAIDIPLFLVQIARADGKRRAQALLDLLADTRSYTLSTQLPDHYIERSAACFTQHANGKRAAWPDAGAANIAENALAFLRGAAEQSPAPRRRMLDMFALLTPLPLLDGWEIWWSETQRLLQRGRGLMRANYSDALRHELESAATAVRERARSQPANIAFAEIIENIRLATVPRCSELYLPLFELLRALPPAQHAPWLRPVQLTHWLRLFDWHKERAVALLGEVRTFANTCPQQCAPLTPALGATGTREDCYAWHLLFYDRVLEELADASAWRVLFEALRRSADAGLELTESDAQRLIALCKVTNDAARASRYFRELKLAKLSDQGYWLSEQMFLCAQALDADGDRFTAIVVALSSVVQEDNRGIDPLPALARQLAHAGWPSLARDLVLSGEARALLLSYEKQGALLALGLSAPSPPARPSVSEQGWVRRYPAALRPALAVLAALAADAPKLADRVLGQHFPHPERLVQEIAVLERRLQQHPDDARLATRLTNRRRQRHQPADVSQTQLAKLEKKLLHLVHLRVLHAWDAQIARDLEAYLRETLDVVALPDWLLQPRQLRLLTAFAELSAPTRRLAWRLLRARCAPPPWRLPDDPANLAFIAHLRALGVDPNPWLDPPAPQFFRAPNGMPVWLAFEHDPLEIFQMGAHFETCLSPGNFNFFSVFANAADINKHVIYARDNNGRVLGRCLIALTERGALLTFAAYCHDSRLGFADMVAALVMRMAEQMKTAVVPSGSVPCLVAPNWYDDGPRDLCQRFEFLQRGSRLQAALEKMSIELSVAALQTAFAPIPLNAMSLPLILEMQVMEERPQLVVPLLPYLEACKGLPEQAWMRAAALALRAGEHSFAHRLLRQRAVPYLLRQHRRTGYLDLAVVRSLVEIDPSAALQVLRRTRARRVRDDAQERDRNRIELLASAHSKLNRPMLAQSLLSE
jgi:hypothetical protein